MATPAFSHRTAPGQAPASYQTQGPAQAKAARDVFQLREMPHEDVFFYSKRIDNSRLVRESDPKAGKRCWSAVGVAALMLAFMTGVLAPSLANTIAGYKLEGLRAEERQLTEERRVLEVREAELVSPVQLDRLARERNLTVPLPNQIVHLNPKGESAMAMVRK